MFSDENVIKLEINNNITSRKTANIWKYLTWFPEILLWASNH